MSEKTISRYCPFKGFWVLGVLHKSVWLRSLTLCVEPFRFMLQIFGDIHNRKNDLVSWGVNKMVYRYNVSKADSPTPRLTESFSDYEYLHEFKTKIVAARNVV